MPEGAAGLYLHVPFCSVVCPYCDFAVRTGRPRHHLAYADALIAEIDQRADAGFVFDSVYLGGGTPSALKASELERILGAVRRELDVEPTATVSMEVNPEDVSAESLSAWRSLGVSSLSLGVQSFDDASLKLLGRRHSGEVARRSVGLALAAGFDTVSIDLMFALPGRDEAGWRAELATAIALEPQHVSCYQLTFHEGTPFHRKRERGELLEPGEDEQAGLFHLTHRLLAEGGFEAYEVSNFARGLAHRSHHNQKYWRHVPYLGLGPSAHSFDGRRRWWNLRTLDDWQAAIEAGERPVADEETLGPQDLALEALMLGLRTTDGVDLAAIRTHTGLDLLPGNTTTLAQLQSEGLLHLEGEVLRPTLAGLAVADSLPTLFTLPT